MIAVTIGVGDSFLSLAKDAADAVKFFYRIDDVRIIDESFLHLCPDIEKFKSDRSRRIFWLKFLVPIIFPDVERWLYFDADYRPIRSPGKNDLDIIHGDPNFVAVRDWWECPPYPWTYYNAGFYVANRTEHGKLFEWCRTNYFNCREKYGEQCVMNEGLAVLGSKVTEMPRSFNTGKAEQCDAPIGVHGYWFDHRKRWCRCGNAGPEDYNQARLEKSCHVCWLQRWHPDKMPSLGGVIAKKTEPKKKKKVRSKPCAHRSESPHRFVNACTSCGVFHCSLLQAECANMLGGLASCFRCNHYQEGEIPKQPANWPIKFDEGNLAPGRPGKRFNSSIIATDDGYVLAYRDGWRGSNIYFIQLDGDLNPSRSPVFMESNLFGSSYGREDPRLFRHKGAIHVAFIGVEGSTGISRTNQCFARLGENLQVEDVWQVDVPHRRGNEKNWAFFDYQGELFAVYLTLPKHEVVKVDCNRATLAYSEQNPFQWSGGEVRGGAMPVKIGSEYWSFFHDRVSTHGGFTFYRMGLYTFDARPPFRPRRMIPEPILVADQATNVSHRGDPPNYCACVFPSGAVKRGDEWIISMGVHDRWTELRKYDHHVLEKMLVSAE